MEGVSGKRTCLRLLMRVPAVNTATIAATGSAINRAECMALDLTYRQARSGSVCLPWRYRGKNM